MLLSNDFFLAEFAWAEDRLADDEVALIRRHYDSGFLDHLAAEAEMAASGCFVEDAR